MYNPVTESIITSIPPVEDIDPKQLPMLLTRAYAEILIVKDLGLRADVERKLSEDSKHLRKLAFALELYLLSPKFKDAKESIAFVAATALKTLLYIDNNENSSVLTAAYIPEEIVAALLFIISGNFTESAEICRLKVTSDREIGNEIIYILYSLIGNENISYHPVNFNTAFDDIEDYAIDLLFLELYKGINSLSNAINTGDVYDSGHIDSVLNLSSTNEKYYMSSYAGIYHLAWLIKQATPSFIKHSTLKVSLPFGVDKEEWESWLVKYNNKYHFLWDNHIEAISQGILDNGKSAVITFPTGAGKSSLINMKIASCLSSNRSVIYIVPTHSLEKQVIQQLKQLFDDVNIGRSSEDEVFTEIYSEEKEKIDVVTPERCITKLNLQDDFLDNVGLVVFDEFHIINSGSSRSLSSMGCLLNILNQKPDADYLLISAMVSNGDEVSGWIKDLTQRDCVLLNLEWKPTSQLQGVVVFKNQETKDLQDKIHIFKNKIDKERRSYSTVPVRLKNAMEINPYCLFGLKGKWNSLKTDDYYLTPILNKKTKLSINKWHLTSNNNNVSGDIAENFATKGKKVIIFVTETRFATSILKYLTEKTPSPQYHIEDLDKFTQVFEELGDQKFSYIENCAPAVIHDSLLLPEERKFSEEIFKDPNGVNIIIATPTLAQGINLPADIVLISGDERFDVENGTRTQLDAHEILNAAGRAGRASFNSMGTAILVPSKIINIEGNSIARKWEELRNNIFSKGDQCIEISDPLFEILYHIKDGDYIKENDLILNRMGNDEEKMKSLLSKSFLAYKFKQEGRTNEFEELITALNNLKPKSKETREWVMNISKKAGVNISIVSSIADYIYEKGLDGFYEQLNTTTLVRIFFDYLRQSENYIKDYHIADIIKESLKLPIDTNLTLNDVDQMELLILDYINGLPLKDLERHIPINREEKKLESARRLVLHYIPEFSYQVGIFSFTLIEYLKASGLNDIPDDVKYFSSIVKEGVNSYDMLLYKRENGFMRVHTHNNFEIQNYE